MSNSATLMSTCYGFHLISFCEVASNWDARTLALWPIALSLSFKFTVGYSAVQPTYRWSQHCWVSPLLFDPVPLWQRPRFTSLSFPTLHIHIECVQTFPSAPHLLHEGYFALSSSCVAYNSDRYAQLRALPTFCNASCPVYLWTKHTYRLVYPEISDWSPYTFLRFFIPTVSFSLIYYFGLKLLKDNCKKDSALVGLVPSPSLASLFVVSFYWMPLCPGTLIMVTWFASYSAVSFFIQSLAVSADGGLLFHQSCSETTSHTVQYCRNLCLKGCSILSQWNAPLYFALVLENSCPSPLLITNSICKPDMPFAQLIGPVFPPLFLGRYHYPMFTEKCVAGLHGPLSYGTYYPLYLLLPRFDYVLFLGFSDLAS